MAILWRCLASEGTHSCYITYVSAAVYGWKSVFQSISNGVQKYHMLICILLGKVNQGKASSQIPGQEKPREGLSAFL